MFRVPTLRFCEWLYLSGRHPEVKRHYNDRGRAAPESGYHMQYNPEVLEETP